jgi:hypothetical protein
MHCVRSNKPQPPPPSLVNLFGYLPAGPSLGMLFPRMSFNQQSHSRLTKRPTQRAIPAWIIVSPHVTLL